MTEGLENKSKFTEYHLNQYQPDKLRFSLYDINGYLKRYDKKRRKAHIHLYNKILWFKRGKGKYYIDAKGYDISENTIFVVTKDQTHYFDKNTNYEGILIHFNEQFTLDNAGIDFFSKNDLFQNPNFQPSCQVNADDVYILDDYLNLLHNELTSDNKEPSEEFIMIYLKVILMQIQYFRDKFYKINAYQIKGESKKELMLVKFVRLVEENYKKESNLAYYVKDLNISLRTLSNLTQKLLEKSPSEIIHERIISEAQRMLLKTNHTVNSIGYSLGFSDPSYFVKYFKKHTGNSPLKFRNLAS